jgi:hypothetical protein
VIGWRQIHGDFADRRVAQTVAAQSVTLELVNYDRHQNSFQPIGLPKIEPTVLI